MIRKPAIIFLFLSAGFFSAENAWSRPTSSVTATATATVVEDLTITSEDPLNFGFITPSPQGGAVTVSPGSARSATGGVQAASAFTPATFTVRGSPERNYTIHAPSSITFSVQEQGTGESSASLIRELTVTDFVTYSANTGTTASASRLAQNGQDKIYLGATLIVPAGAAPGVYSGWVPLTVSY